MTKSRPYTLSIAGFDPSGGAGILADVKTFEASKIYGMGVITANTFQDENAFEHVDWIPIEEIKKQVEVVLKNHKIEFAKIGLVENFENLYALVSFLRTKIPGLVWDPILKSSSGYDFHDYFD